ncbi:histidinol dehydrogenase [Caldicoprobacter algeriensis]|uniref:histidinol dehydrogenase n=1 Tax=Caldicoprobacter algeriensis TaxID=699281 RepID=UPI0020796AFA|nr:histidinol dehydrogenase [Caldicoprobacter algeriensis]MCM8900777.1 histidinol dehydrogenase [Caldicoprobacter algeriensis]
MVKLIDGRGKDTAWILSRLSRRWQASFEKEKNAVLEILSAVRQRGDEAVLEYTARFDGVHYASAHEMLVSQEEIQEAYSKVDGSYIDILKHARDNIWKFHSRQLENSWTVCDESGVIMGQRVVPMERVGVYVPGGRAAYPSSVLMNVIPARVAGVSDIIMATPPGKDEKVNPYTLVAACEAGCKRIFKIGGAQAIAALAFGTKTIPRVDKIVGPGNIYVALAKKEVYGYVDIDMIAGPSEVMVLADCSANPAFVAADLMSQAEHDPMASAILVTTSIELASRVLEELQRQVEGLSSKDIIQASLRDFGALIVVDSIEQAIELTNSIAPEHLELAVHNPFEILGAVKHAGSIFLGHYTPEPVGDYMAGPNHVLPTGGTARFFSPLGVYDFVKKSNIIFYTEKALKAVSHDVIEFANREGLTAHANSIKVRFKDNG